MFKNLLFLLVILVMSGCCNEDFIIPSDGAVNDLQANAIDVTALFDVAGNCDVPNPIYTTLGSSEDGGAGDCWSDSAIAGDVWFKAVGQAPYGYISIFVKVGGEEGTQRKSQLVLWDTDGTTQLACSGFSADDDDLFLFYGSLQIGEEYFFSVSVPDEASKGTFSMCVTTSD
jgi:hypothetical protein